MGWFGPQTGDCTCCGPCCEQYIDEMVAAGIAGAEATVTGTYFNHSSETPTSMNGTCGWTSENYLCLATGSDVLLPETPSGSVYWGENSSDAGNCANPTPAAYGYASAGVGAGCDEDGQPLYGASVSFRYRIKVFFVFPGYNAATILAGLGYTEVSTNLWTKDDGGDPALGLYKIASARKSTVGGIEVWDISGFMSFYDPDPTVVAGYTFASWSPWYNPVGSSLSGAVT